LLVLFFYTSNQYIFYGLRYFFCIDLRKTYTFMYTCVIFLFVAKTAQTSYKQKLTKSC